MTVAQLIGILAGICRYNANGEVRLYVNGKVVPLTHCIDDFIDEGDERKRVITLVAEGDDYYGK